MPRKYSIISAFMKKKLTRRKIKNIQREIDLDKEIAKDFNINYEINDNKTNIRVFRNNEIKGYSFRYYEFDGTTIIRRSDGKIMEVGL